MTKRADAKSSGAAGRAEVRLDKWLWSARFYKTRQIAIDAINAGRVDVNGERAKPAKAVRAGDELLIRKPPYVFHISVILLSEKRGSAAIAQTLYAESEESALARQRLSAELRELPPPVFKGRPTKRDRRTLERFIERHADEKS
jgi:ribosome-associated heat shock protein Hsp15